MLISYCCNLSITETATILTYFGMLTLRNFMIHPCNVDLVTVMANLVESQNTSACDIDENRDYIFDSTQSGTIVHQWGII